MLAVFIRSVCNSCVSGSIKKGWDTDGRNHKLVVNNRKTSLVTGVLDVLSFDLNEVFLETEQGMLMVKGSDLHVNRLNLEKGEVDLSGTIDSIAYSDVQSAVSRGENIFAKLFR